MGPSGAPPVAPSWRSTVVVVTLVLGMAVGLATVLLAIGREVGCSLEDDCGSGAWLVVLATLAVMALAAPFVGMAALRDRDRAEARWIAASLFGPGVMWVVAFVVIAA